MRDEAPFIKAILKNPDEVATRLVYADWLEERGDSRGEYLRLSVVLDDPACALEKVQAVQERLRELQSEIDPGWIASLHGRLLARMDRWLAANRPDYYACLQPGVSARALNEFEERFGLTLPRSFRGLYRWRNGQPRDCFESLQDNRMFSSLEDIAETKEMLDGMIGNDFEDPEWWRRSWVPFLANGGGDHLCLDLAAEDGGEPGQLIAFWHDWEDRSVKYESLDDWLHALVESMEDGTSELA
jgi:uncharacterized protein (TIGR02996 family)